MLDPRVLDLNAVIEKTATMLGRIVGEEIEVRVRLDPDLGFARLDPGQIEQVLLNLIVNARDAMPEGGRLEITTRRGLPREARGDGAEAGDGWVVLSIRDTGTGFSAEALAHLFEPFFTTKAMGMGTGLGLSVVRGIVEQSGGRLWIHSEPGHGATVHLAFPRMEADRPTSGSADAGPLHPRADGPGHRPGPDRRDPAGDEPG